MDCQQTTKLLSNYFDGELPGEQRIDVEGHIKNCAICLQQLAFFAKLSEAIRNLSTPAIPREILWKRITAELDKKSCDTDQPSLSKIKARGSTFMTARNELELARWMVMTNEVQLAKYSSLDGSWIGL